MVEYIEKISQAIPNPTKDISKDKKHLHKH
jgi:hypothetical protein